MKTLTENELIALICSADPQDKAALDELLNTAPTMAVSNLLHEIAVAQAPTRMDAKARTVSVGILPIPVWGVLTTVENLHKGKSWWNCIFNMGVLYMLMALHAVVTARGKRKRCRGTEEALFLWYARLFHKSC